MSSLAGALVDAVTALGWTAEPSGTAPDGEHHLVLTPEADDLELLVVAVVHDEPGIVSLYTLAPFDVPDDRRVEAAEFLTRANHGLLLGNFELDLDDGEVRCKTSFWADGRDDLDDEVREQLDYNLTACGTYLPGLAHVANGDLGAAEAIDLIETG